jgi:hypothetical protein
MITPEIKYMLTQQHIWAKLYYLNNRKDKLYRKNKQKKDLAKYRKDNNIIYNSNFGGRG